MTDWKRVLKTICPRGKSSIIAGLAAEMPRCVEVAGLQTLQRQAHFLAQVAHESAGLRTTVEYASGAAYEGRRDLGNTHPGDGRRFRGRGLIQLTGRANYTDMSHKTGVDLVSDPEAAARFPIAAHSAAVFWRSRDLNADADADNLRAVTRKINGGYNGLAQRAAYLKAAKRALGVGVPVRFVEADARPMDEITVADLRSAGSRTIAAADQIRTGVTAITAALTGAGAAVEQAGDVVSQARDAIAGAQAGAGWLDLAKTYWPIVAVAAALCVVLWGVWRIWHGAVRIQAARLDDAQATAAAFEG